MSARLIGVSPTERIPAGSLLRLVFGETHSFTNDDQFGKHFSGDVYPQLPPVAHLFPITGPGVTASQNVTTIDATNHLDREAADIVNAVESLCGWWVELRSLELLTSDEKRQATTQAGADARQQASAKSAADAAASNPLTKFLEGLGVAASTLKWVAIAVVLLVILIEVGGVTRTIRHD